MNWISENSEILSLALSALMALIWIVYLQIFAMGYLRQRRPIVLISRTAGTGDSARCFVSNMGAEPIYLTALIADVCIGDTLNRSFVTDRDELGADDIDSPGDATNQGPLSSGSYLDAGNFGTILKRALDHLDLSDHDEQVSELRLTVLCNSGHSNLLVAASRSFRVGWADGTRMFIPRRPQTDQASSYFRRLHYHRVLQQAIDDEAARLTGHDG